MDKTSIEMTGSAGAGNQGKQQHLRGWRWNFELKVLSTLGVALVGLLIGGCPGKPDGVDPQQPRSIQPSIKSGGGQTIAVPNRSPPPPTSVAIIRDTNAGATMTTTTTATGTGSVTTTYTYDTPTVNSMVSQAVTSALGPGGIANLVHSGQSVLIKPNMVTNKASAVTDWHVVKALVDLIQTVNGGANITIADGSSTQETITAVMVNQGYTTANFPGVTFLNFNDTTNTSPTNTYVLADSRTGASEKIPSAITDADVYIDMPRMKTHYHAGMTGALKNLGIGTGPMPVWNVSGGNLGTGGSAKFGLHHDIRSEIVDHVACRVPDFTLMDAIVAMEGQGPASGTLVLENLVLAGKDPVAVDAVAATIMGIPPYLITHMVLAANENIGVMDLNNITTTGNITLAAASAIHTFVRATPGAVQAPIEPGVVPYRATTVIRTAPSAMTIDGDLSEWGYANTMTADASYQVKGGGSGWGGASDSSFTAQTLYDAQNLYLAVKVKDNVKQANANTGSAIVNGDGIELYLTTFNEQYNTTSRTYGSSYDYHLAISYAAAPQAYMLSHSRALNGAVISKVDTADGYIIEALIPWSNFGSPTLTPGALAGGYVEYRQMGINVALNDADTNPSTVEHELLWGNAADSDVESNPIKIGMSYIDPPGGLYPTLSFTLTTAAANGTVAKSPDQATYQAGTVVSLTATPDPGYTFTGWSGSLTSTANPVTVTMDGKKIIMANFQAIPVLTSVTVSPTTATLNVGSAQQFTAVAYDQSNNPLSPQPNFTWWVNGGGAIDGSGLFTAGATAGGPFIVTAQTGSVSGTATVTVTVNNGAPTVVIPAAAMPSPVTGATTALSVLGDDDNGEASLTYTWSTTGTPPAAVTFSTNGTNVAKNATATFTKAGDYNFLVTITDQGSLTATSAVAVTVNQTVTSIAVAPTAATINASATQQFTATAKDQFVANLTTQPTFTWSVSGGGTISTAGLYIAGTTAGGPYTVTATSGSVSGTASVTVAAAPTAVYQINCGGSAASPFKADQYGSGGTARTVTNTITISGITNPAPAAVYQSERYGNSTYTFPSLTSGASYTVRLHFAELYQTASGKRKFNVAINGTTVLSSFDIYATAGAAYKAVLKEFTATANSSGQIVVAFTTVTDNATIEGIEIISSTPNSPPTVATAATASPNPVTGATAALSVLGADDKGESNLTYTWATTGTPPAAVTFSANGTNAAKSTTTTFTKAGSYSLQATIKDQSNATVTSTVAVTVNATLTSIVLSPTSASVSTSGTQQFTATARDQFTTNLTTQPTFTWTVSGGGTVSGSGLFTAGTTAGGPYTLTATSGGKNGTASVTVSAVNTAPTIATAAAASPNPVTATTAALSVLGADNGGETNLTYTWATTGTPPASVTFSANGTNAAKATTATFTKAGSYTFQVTVKDTAGLTATSSVAVTVSATLTSIVASPASATVNTAATQQFTATARDQFTTNLATQPTFTWTVSGGGTINTSGLFTAGTTAGGPYTVTASSGGKSGTASVTVAAASTTVYQINCGGAAASPFKADQYGSGGTARTVTNTITISGITNPAPAAVYQSERYGNSTYTFPSLTSGASYTVRLHFAELYQTASGKRKFNVAINGTTVLSSFDIYATAGAAYKAVLKEFTATANSSGQIVVALTKVTDNATIEGIEIIKK